MNILKLATALAKHKIADTLGIQPPLPFNYTLGLTYRCNAKCLTCNVTSRASENELTAGEWEKIFTRLGHSPYWVTFTGGEPFLYSDLVEVYYHLVRLCKPAIVNIPTNGLLTDRIVSWTWQMSRLSQQTRLIINVSLDHYKPELNDHIRGVRGYFDRAVRTLQELQNLKLSNLDVGIHTVVSVYNVDDLPLIARYLRKYLNDRNRGNYITEIAEQREELRNKELQITPDRKDYSLNIQCLTTQALGHNVKQTLRRHYYSNVIRYLESGKHGMSCYAGSASVQITPDGDVWNCCIKAETLGNLRNCDYDLKPIWSSSSARDARSRARHCYCPLANVAYTNMLLNFRSVAAIIWSIIKAGKENRTQ